MTQSPNIVIVGGGTGSYVLASGLKHHPVNLTLLLTMVDDGGSNQVIRDEFGLLPTSGIRQAMVALSENESVLKQLFMYRFAKGGPGLNGMTFGNIFMAALTDILGSQKAAIEETSRLMQVKGAILPISYDDVRLVATYEDGSQVVGQHNIDHPEDHDGALRITKLETNKPATISAEAKQALLDADLIIFGPGDFYGNTISNLIIEGVAEAIQQSSAKLLFITNLMTKYGETYNYTLKDYFSDLKPYLPLERIDWVLINNNLNFPPKALEIYTGERAIPVVNDIDQSVVPNAQIIQADLLSVDLVEPEPGDTIPRSVVRHDSDLLARQIMQIVVS